MLGPNLGLNHNLKAAKKKKKKVQASHQISKYTRQMRNVVPAATSYFTETYSSPRSVFKNICRGQNF